MSENHSYVFLIGAPKSGTSTLANWLAAHPNVAVSAKKEPSYFTDFAGQTWAGPKAERFAQSIQTTREAYMALFAHRPEAKWRLDASTDYLSCPASPEKLSTFAQTHQVKVAVILRDPVQRIVSEYQHTLRDGYQRKTLCQSLALEEDRRAQGYIPLFRHLERSRYSAAVSRYDELFGENFMVLDYHKGFNTGAPLEALCGFIGVEMPEVDLGARANQGAAPRNQMLRKLMRADRVKRAARAVLPQAVRKRAWTAIESANKTTYEAAPADLAFLREALRNELQACEANPLIDTSGWTTAFPDR